MRYSLIFLIAFAVACGEPTKPVVGPFTGLTSRWVMDGFHFSYQDVDSPESNAWSGHQQLGNLLGAISGFNDGSTAEAAMRNSGVLRSSLEITSDDPAIAEDPSVGVRYLASADDTTAIELGGRLKEQRFQSNSAFESSSPFVAGSLLLPVFRYADPIRLNATNVETAFNLQGTHVDVLVRGGVLDADIKAAVFPNVKQMVAFRPVEFSVLLTFFDPDHDGVISRAESDAAVDLFLRRDAQIDASGHVSLLPYGEVEGNGYSIGIAVRFVRCESGWCGDDTKPCTDRVRDGDETDVDCGGFCGACSGTATCAIDADCESNHCDDKTCRAPGCFDGVRDGYESDVDCGGTCDGCDLGQKCNVDKDCASGACSGTLGPGKCEPNSP